MKLEVNGVTITVDGAANVNLAIGQAIAEDIRGLIGSKVSKGAEKDYLNRSRRSVLPSREALIEYLSEGVCQIKFTKVGGESRTIGATLLAAYIPAQTGSSANHGVRDLSTIPFWSVADDGWRSTRLAAIEEFHTQDLALPDLQAHVLKGSHPVEFFGEMLDLKKRHRRFSQ